MKKTILFVAACLATLSASAQTKADIQVSYDCVAPNKSDKLVTTKMTLLVSPAEAKFFNDLSQWVDSLKSTPEGNAKYQDLLRKSCMTVDEEGVQCWDLTKGPVKKVHTYVFTRPADASLTLYSKYGEDLGQYTEPLDEMQWTLVEDSTATVLGYECVMAETDYHGRRWKAWFAPEVPMSFGPWKLRGLPGLILKAVADGGFSYVATAIEKSDRPIMPMYQASDYAKVDRLKALANAEYYNNNQESIMNAQGQKVEIYSVDDNGNKVAPPRFDGLRHSLEPDYKTKK